MKSPWTPEQDAELKLLMDRGETTREAAEVLNERFAECEGWPKSRNAIIGRMHRLNAKPPAVPAEPGEPVGFWDLGLMHCRWTISGDGLAALYCGAERIRGGPYCLAHARQSWASRAGTVWRDEGKPA